MDCGSVGGQRTQRLPGHRRLLFLPAGLSGRPGGCETSARRCLSALCDGLGALRPRAPATRGCVSRASPLLLLLLVPSPRLAAAAPRRQLGDWERSRLGYAAPPAGRSGAWRCPPGLGPGVAAAAGALPQCKGPAPALVSCRRELSLSAGHLQLERRRDFTSSGSRRLYFDTHALVCLLEDNGFATQQAEIIVSALVKILEANMDVVYKDMVTKMQQEITFQQIMSQIVNVKKDMIILEKSEFSALRAENEKIKLELHQLKQQVMDEMIKVRTDTKLDFNLEKSRVKELHAQQDRALTQTDRKIETEVAGLKTMLESHKLDNIKYLAGSIFTCLTVALGFYRLWI
ncbi:PREDICTED: mitochondrial calcium uniporter regulator 1 isoform X2 [Cercocebus atys]|uniref:mitochondrial calcium uniporter regulator 1 isoform X2 n=1 Tax=Cercocebus atys TaxID=9531 RepID=UPI0005F43842|nr:PREDICTED: mitochondrial calcium uniporter regulator 1 isoform X2 [Cercocebus atys]